MHDGSAQGNDGHLIQNHTCLTPEEGNAGENKEEGEERKDSLLGLVPWSQSGSGCVT